VVLRSDNPLADCLLPWYWMSRVEGELPRSVKKQDVPTMAFVRKPPFD